MDEIKDPAALAGEPDPGAAIAGDPAAAITAQSPSAAPHHVFLIDGSGFIFRAYFARARDPKVERFQRQSDGTPTEVVMIFSNMLDKYRRETDADHMAVIFDAVRHQLPQPDLRPVQGQPARNAATICVPQFEHVRRAADAFDICRIEMDGFEADDLIATYARLAVEAGAKVTIVSSDKDLMQLVGDRVTMRDPMSDRPIGAAEVREKFGVGPDKVIEVQALCGDSVDNVPGVPGIGVKTAAELINAYGDLETLLARAAEIKQPKRRQALIDNEDQARLSKVLVKLDDDVPVPCPLSALEVKPYDPDKLFPFLDEMELRALKTRIAQRLSVTAPAAAPEHPEPAIPQVPPFSAPRSYALIDTAEGLDHWIEAAYQAGAVAIWPVTSAVAGAAAGTRRDRAGAGAGARRLCPAGASRRRRSSTSRRPPSSRSTPRSKCCGRCWRIPAF